MEDIMERFTSYTSKFSRLAVDATHHLAKACSHRAAILLVSTLAISGVFACGTAESKDAADSGGLNTNDAGKDAGGDCDGGDCGVAGDPMSPFNLDETGKTIPDTNYPIPAGAIFMATTGDDGNAGTEQAPVATINKAVELAPADGTIVIRGGVYRDSFHQKDKPYYYKIITKKLTYQAYPHEQVWFDGTEVQETDSWTSDGQGRWYKAWNTPQFCDGAYYDFPYDRQAKGPDNLVGASGKVYESNRGPCAHYDVNSAPEYPAATDPQLAYIDGKRLQEVASVSSMGPDEFYYDWANKRIYIPSDPNGHVVELATRPLALVVGSGAGGSQIKGLGFRRYATNEYSNLTGAAVYMGGTNFLVQDSVFTENAAAGLYMAPQGGTMNHSAFVNNGFSSSGGNGHSEGGDPDNVQITNNLISNNNTEHFNMYCTLSCGQAGMKMAHMKGFTIKHNIFKNNEGGGFWCDENCTGATIVDNLIINNTGPGIFYEVSSDGIIASNVVAYNTQTGIRVVSATTKVYNNTVITSGANEAIWVYDDARNQSDPRGSQVGPDTTDVSVVNNVIYNTNNTVSSLSAQGTSTSATNTVPDQFFTTVDYNAYYRQNGPSKRLIRWIGPGTGGASHSEDTYYSTSSFFDAKGFDEHSIDITTGDDPFFVDVAGGNYDIRADSAAFESGTALPADVAEAIGISPSAGQNRGALIWPGKQ